MEKLAGRINDSTKKPASIKAGISLKVMVFILDARKVSGLHTPLAITTPANEEVWKSNPYKWDAIHLHGIGPSMVVPD